mmetsp:Transcript_5990/g.9083  ORF Transcript_5990/g.9083 Transcript_5990/m.9083 type:complete len:242 (+) Transcript_5990:74-799(+)
MIPVGDEASNESSSVINEDRSLTAGTGNGWPNSRATPKIQYAISKRWEAEQETGQSAQCTPQNLLSSIFCCCARRVGSLHFLCERKDGSPIVVAGPMWPFCMFVTVPLVAGLSSLVLYFCILQKDAPLPSWFVFIYAPVMAITLVSLFMVSCRNPGLVERKTSQDQSSNAFLWNEQVGSYRPPDALYCRECQVLIEEMDHVCPWTGTAIGKRNMLAFKCFVVSVNLLCYSSIAITAFVLLS